MGGYRDYEINTFLYNHKKETLGISIAVAILIFILIIFLIFKESKH